MSPTVKKRSWKNISLKLNCHLDVRWSEEWRFPRDFLERRKRLLKTKSTTRKVTTLSSWIRKRRKKETFWIFKILESKRKRKIFFNTFFAYFLFFFLPILNFILCLLLFVAKILCVVKYFPILIPIPWYITQSKSKSRRTIG